ncbi:SRPBCC family protein [Actinomadura rugatobispora]|uniref:SRPBCC family protein n=1 Tax=Actinomadura rugatobispora TaxID=1994 RepID=A0ABW1AAC0_9ACTN
MASSEIEYTTYIHASPEQLWRALTDPAFTWRYWGVAYESDWRVGSPVKVQVTPDGDFSDLGSVVLESEPYRRLSFSNGTAPPEHLEQYGRSADDQADEPRRSTTTFDIEPMGATVKLTLVHAGLQPTSEDFDAYAEGWPQVLSSLKTLLETGETLPLPTE